MTGEQTPMRPGVPRFPLTGPSDVKFYTDLGLDPVRDVRWEIEDAVDGVLESVSSATEQHVDRD
jgi:hypothetical protein